MSRAAFVLALLGFVFSAHSLAVSRLHASGRGPSWQQHFLVWGILLTALVLVAAVPFPILIAVLALWVLIAPLVVLRIRSRGVKVRDQTPPGPPPSTP